jgi:hypothetical protein
MASEYQVDTRFSSPRRVDRQWRAHNSACKRELHAIIEEVIGLPYYHRMTPHSQGVVQACRIATEINYLSGRMIEVMDSITCVARRGNGLPDHIYAIDTWQARFPTPTFTALQAEQAMEFLKPLDGERAPNADELGYLNAWSGRYIVDLDVCKVAKIEIIYRRLGYTLPVPKAGPARRLRIDINLF